MNENETVYRCIGGLLQSNIPEVKANVPAIVGTSETASMPFRNVQAPISDIPRSLPSAVPLLCFCQASIRVCLLPLRDFRTRSAPTL